MDSDPFKGMLGSWELAMRAANKAPRTVTTYGSAVIQFADWLGQRGVDDDVTLPAAVLRAELREFLTDILARNTSSTALNRYAGLQQFFKWLVAEGEIEASPMAGLERPKVTPPAVEVLDEDKLRALVTTCSGASLVDRRDMALIRLFADTGVRCSEMAGLAVGDVDIKDSLAYVMGKGRRPRAVPFGPRTALALDRYVRARTKHPQADRPELWLGEKGKGPLTDSGIRQMLERRGDKIGVHLHPHMLRHAFAHHWLADGGTEGDLMRIGGWKSRQMLDRYGATAADARARAAHKRHGLSDRI